MLPWTRFARYSHCVVLRCSSARRYDLLTHHPPRYHPKNRGWWVNNGRASGTDSQHRLLVLLLDLGAERRFGYRPTHCVVLPRLKPAGLSFRALHLSGSAFWTTRSGRGGHATPRGRRVAAYAADYIDCVQGRYHPKNLVLGLRVTKRDFVAGSSSTIFIDACWMNPSTQLIGVNSRSSYCTTPCVPPRTRVQSFSSCVRHAPSNRYGRRSRAFT